MTWFKVDDKLWGHQKWVSTPPGARALWVTAGSWCADHLTDGFVPAHMLGIFGARSGDSRKLVEIGLWETVDGGWRFRDWSDYQPSHDKVVAERDAARQRQHDARERAKRRAMSRRDGAVTDGVTSPLVTDLSHDPDPTRPDPTRPVVPTELPEGKDSLPSSAVADGAIEPKYPVTFLEFWAVYPRHAGKDAALRAWQGAAKRAGPAAVIAGARRFAADPNLPEPQFVPHAATWLHDGRWTDEPLPNRVNGHARASPQSTTDQRVGQAVALAQRLRAQENPRREIEA